MNTILSFNSLSFAYPESPLVLNRLSLDFARGSITALLGPNGAGKTTLLHLALGWLRPASGQVQLEGRTLGSYARMELGQRIGLVPQSENISFEYTVLEYVLLGRAPYLPPLAMPGEEDLTATQLALSRVGLNGFEMRSMLELSGGERQLVLIARSLAQNPQILLLDEPTSHLDLGNKARLVQIFKMLQRQGVTILLTTHDPELAALLSTHIVLMGRGSILADGLVADVLTAENLSQLYGVPVRMAEVAGQKVILW